MRSAAHLALLAMSADPFGTLPELRARRDSHAYQTDEQRDAAKARAAAKRARKNARRLALRDAGRKRAVERIIRREAAATERRNAQVLALAVSRAAAEIGR